MSEKRPTFEIKGVEMFRDYVVALDLDFVRRITDRVNALLDLAFVKLCDDGVTLERMKLWRQANNNDCGILVDDQKACTVSSRWIGEVITIALEWHPPFRKLEDEV